MFEQIDQQQWDRRQQFEFFRPYTNPNFNLCGPVDISGIVAYRKKTGASLHLLYHYIALRAANELEAFAFRIVGDQVIKVGTIHCGTTLLKEDNTFGFCYFNYSRFFQEFSNAAHEATEKFKTQEVMEPQPESFDLLHCTTMPWVSFTSVQHPYNRASDYGIPKLAFGKIYQEGDRWKMPLSLQGHHALMDGYHAGRFFQRVEMLGMQTNPEE